MLPAATVDRYRRISIWRVFALLEDAVQQIQSRGDLSRFVEMLANDFRDNPDEWENTDIYRYLEALSAWITDMDGYYRNIYNQNVPESPDWKLCGMMLIAAKYYE